MASTNPTQSLLTPHPTTTTFPDVEAFPEVNSARYQDLEEMNHQIRAYNLNYAGPIPFYNDDQPSSGISRSMPGFNWANQNQTYSTSPLSSYGHVVESAWKQRDGEIVFERAARLQEVSSSADSHELRVFDPQDEPLPFDTTPPPAPHRHLKSLTPSLGPSHAPSLQSSPKRQKGLGLEYSTGPNSPAVSQGWSPWISRRVTETNFSGASSLLRAPGSSRVPLDQEIVAARLNDVLEQQPSSRRHAFSPFRRSQHSNATNAGKSSFFRNSTAGSKRGVSFASPSSTPVVPSLRPLRSPPPPPVSKHTSASSSLADESVAQARAFRAQGTPKRTETQRRHSPRPLSTSEDLDIHHVPSPTDRRPSARPISPTPASSDSLQHPSRPSQQYETARPQSRVKFRDYPATISSHSPSPPPRQPSPALLPPGLSRSRNQRHHQREEDSLYGRNDYHSITQIPLDPLSPFTDGHHPDLGLPGTNNVGEKLVSSSAYDTHRISISRKGNGDQHFRTTSARTPDPLDTSTPWAALPVPVHEESPTSIPFDAPHTSPLVASRAVNTWPNTFWPGHDRPRSSSSIRQSAAFVQRSSSHFDKLQDQHGQPLHHYPYHPGEALPSGLPDPYTPATDPMKRSRKRQQREEFDTPLGPPQFESTPPRGLRRVGGEMYTAKQPSSSIRPPTPPQDIVELLETNIRHLGFALGDIDGLSSYFGKMEFIYDVNPHAVTSEGVRKALDGLTSALKRHKSLTREQLQLATHRWQVKRADRLRSLWRTIHGFGRFVHTITRREPTSNILTKALAKLDQFESKLSNLALKFNSLLNRLRVRQLYSMLSRAHLEASEQLKHARSGREIPGWEAGKKYRAELRREYVDFRNRFARARRASLRS